MLVIEDMVKRIVEEKAKRTIGVIFQPRLEEMFSCLFLWDGDNHFIAKAGHCLSSEIRGDELLAATAQKPFATRVHYYGRASYRSRDDYDPDMAILALPAKSAAEIPVEWQTRESCDSRAATDGQLVCVAGFPSQLIRVAGENQELVGAALRRGLALSGCASRGESFLRESPGAEASLRTRNDRLGRSRVGGTLPRRASGHHRNPCPEES